jgi:hypothetical protein
MLEDFLKDHGFEITRYGYDQMLRDEPGMKAKMKKFASKASLPCLMVKFSPDFVVSHKSSDKKILFFMDAKSSITPVFFQMQINRISEHSGLELYRKDIGEIEREAWYVYNTFYPRDKVAIVMAAPYNPNLIVADWVSNVKCLWCIKQSGSPPVPWNCENCPVFITEGTFGVMVNEFAGGSKTPHTNIHLGKMRSLKKFLEVEFDVKIDSDWYQTLMEEVKSWDLNKPVGRVTWGQFNGAVNDMKKTCPWLKNRWPGKKDKDQSNLDGY